MVNLPRYWHLACALCLVLLSAGCSKSPPTKDQILSRANDHFAAGQYVAAEADYREALRLDPKDPTAVRQLGLIYFDQGELPQAYTALRKAAELEPDNLDVQVKLAKTEFSARQFKDARELATAILDKNPGNEDALILLASTAGPYGDADDVRTLIQGYRDKDTDRPGYHLALGRLALIQNDQAQAETEFKAALALDAKSANAYLALATIYRAKGDAAQAGEALKTAADLSPMRSPLRLSYAEFKRQTGDTAGAKSIAEQISKAIPDALPPRVYLMKIACEEKAADCPELVKKILEEDPLSYDGLLQSGMLSIANKDGAQALRTFGRMAQIYQGVADVRYRLAEAYLLNGQNDAEDKAVDSLNTALKFDPHLDQAALLLAELKIRKQQYAAAIDLLNLVVKDQPQLPQARYLLAASYVAQQNTPQALAIYRQMEELFPKDPQPAFLIGMILSSQQKLPEARASIEQALKIAPDYLPAFERLVDLDIAEKKYDDAIDLLQKQIDKKPDNAQLLGIRAKVYLAQKDFPHAEADLVKAIQLDPKLERAYLMLAELYLSSNRQDQAIEKLNAFVEKNKDIPSLMLLAAIHDQMKQHDAAGDAYKKVLEINPNFFAALNNLAVLDTEYLGQLDAGLELAKKARALAPDNPNAADTLGWALFKKGNYDDALPLLQQSVSKLPDDFNVQFHLGMTFYQKGDEGSARSAFQKALAPGRDFSGKDEATKRLAVLSIDTQNANAATRATLDDYLKGNPNDPIALIRLAQVQQRDGDMDGATKIDEKILTINPQFGPALKQLALLDAKQAPDDKKTYDLVGRARLAYPDDFELAKTLGILTYRRGDYRRALELLQLVSDKDKNDPETLFYLGMSHYQLKQFDKTKEELERVLTMKDLSQSNADEAKRALADCCASD